MGQNSGRLRRVRRTIITVLFVIGFFWLANWFTYGLDDRRLLILVVVGLAGWVLVLWSLEAREAFKVIANEDSPGLEPCEASEQLIAWARSALWSPDPTVEILERGDPSTAEYRGAMLDVHRLIARQRLRGL